MKPELLTRLFYFPTHTSYASIVQQHEGQRSLLTDAGIIFSDKITGQKRRQWRLWWIITTGLLCVFIRMGGNTVNMMETQWKIEIIPTSLGKVARCYRPQSTEHHTVYFPAGSSLPSFSPLLVFKQGKLFNCIYLIMSSSKPQLFVKEETLKRFFAGNGCAYKYSAWQMDHWRNKSQGYAVKCWKGMSCRTWTRKTRLYKAPRGA